MLLFENDSVSLDVLCDTTQLELLPTRKVSLDRSTESLKFSLEKCDTTEN